MPTQAPSQPLHGSQEPETQQGGTGGHAGRYEPAERRTAAHPSGVWQQVDTPDDTAAHTAARADR